MAERDVYNRIQCTDITEYSDNTVGKVRRPGEEQPG